jgi:hypothetical protein
MEEALALQILGSTSAAVSDVRGKSWTTSCRPSKVSSGWHSYAGPPFPPSSVVESYCEGLGKWNSLRAARPSQHGAVGRCQHIRNIPVLQVDFYLRSTTKSFSDSAVFQFSKCGRGIFIIFSGCVWAGLIIQCV